LIDTKQPGLLMQAFSPILIHMRPGRVRRKLTLTSKLKVYCHLTMNIVKYSFKDLMSPLCNYSKVHSFELEMIKIFYVELPILSYEFSVNYFAI
jgi:hypothetical protein